MDQTSKKNPGNDFKISLMAKLGAIKNKQIRYDLQLQFVLSDEPITTIRLLSSFLVIVSSVRVANSSDMVADLTEKYGFSNTRKNTNKYC